MYVQYIKELYSSMQECANIYQVKGPGGRTTGPEEMSDCSQQR